MSSGLDKAIKDFIQIIQEAGNKGTSPLDAQAEVLRIDEDGTAWVHLPGGVDETPVRLTINAEVGDKVHVRLSGGRAWITGNQTAPPTDDKTAKVAKSLANLAGNQARTAQKTADQAQIVADSALKGTKENAAQMAQMILDFNGDIENLQDQIDGNIATWFYDVDPAMNLPPVTDWDTNEKKDAHLGDIYYNTVKGYAWRFMKSGSTYSWERITDTDVTKALADAAKAQDTADSKRRVFYNTPTVPYDAGDLWVQGSGGDILRCAQAKTSAGSYDRNDWILASKYTDDSALNTWIERDFATIIQGLEEGLADAKIETYYQATDPSAGWSDTQKSEHEGDLWYNSTASVQKYYRWSGTAWQELTATPPQAVFDNIDKKATIYTGTTTPTNPNSGDLWFKGVDEPILTYVNGSWVEYNKYTATAEEAAKSATDFIAPQTTQSDNDGVKVFPKAERANPQNYTQINQNGVGIYQNGSCVASFGTNTTIGRKSGKHVYIDPDSFNIKNAGNVLASFKADKIELGKDNRFAKIDFCGGQAALENIGMSTYLEKVESLETGEKGISDLQLMAGKPNGGLNIGLGVGSVIRWTGSDGDDANIGGRLLISTLKNSASANLRANYSEAGRDKSAIVTCSVTGSTSNITMSADSITINGNPLADFVVERGTSGIWTWEKWASGKAVCYGTYSGSVTLNTAQGRFYYSAVNGAKRINYPSGLFNSIPKEYYSMHNSGVLCWVETGSTNTKTQTAMYRVLRDTKSTTKYTIYLDLYVLGRWK